MTITHGYDQHGAHSYDDTMAGEGTLGALHWDEPAGCSSPRGWLHNDALGACVGFYLDYGPDNYRTGHKTEIYPGKVVSFCQPGRLCRDCEPGDILAVRYPNGPRDRYPLDSRYVETIAQAREYVKTGAVKRT